jgi:general secretion pathway protein M
MNALRHWYETLAPRERRFILSGAAATLLLLLLALLLPLNRSVAAAERRLQQKRADLAWLEAMAPQLATLGATRPAPAANDESLVVLADRVARATSIERSLTGSQPSGDGGLRVRLEKVPFDALAAWMGQLAQQHGVRVENASIEATAAPGQVNATIVLRAR